MSKRRTRKQKEEVKHPFTISWHPEAKTTDSEANVNRQIKKPLDTIAAKSVETKSPKITAQYSDLASVKRDIVKSLSLASLILASEVVLYLIWR